MFEDLHWADEALLDFIEQLLEWTTDTPLLVLCTARPELLERRTAWWSGSGTLVLPPLSDGETETLVTALLDEVPLPAAAQDVLLERAHGNPLYAQEYTRMLIDRGLIVRRDDRWALATEDELPLPETVHGIIAARLDALTSDEKAVIQDASVIGKVVWLGAVAHVERRDPSFVHGQLQALRRKQLLRLERHTPLPPSRNTRSRTHSSATSPTRRSSVRRAPTNTFERPSGSSRSVIARTVLSYSPTTTSPPSSWEPPPGWPIDCPTGREGHCSRPPTGRSA